MHTLHEIHACVKTNVLKDQGVKFLFIIIEITVINNNSTTST